MARDRSKYVIPDAKEDAAITAAAVADPDNQPLTDKQLAALAPVTEIKPELAVRHRRRGRPTGSNKEQVTMRLDKDLLVALGKGIRDGWQTRANDLLRLATGLESDFDKTTDADLKLVRKAIKLGNDLAADLDHVSVTVRAIDDAVSMMSPSAASLAAITLGGSGVPGVAKSLAASALSQSRTGKQTGAVMEEKAARVLQSDKYAADTLTLAGTVTSQANKSR